MMFGVVAAARGDEKSLDLSGVLMEVDQHWDDFLVYLVKSREGI